MSQIQEKNSGMILILSILVIGAILGTIIIFANLITREIQQSRLIDQSIHAFYLAESGAERALYQTRRREAVKEEDCSIVMAPLNSECINSAGSGYGTCEGSGGQVACITYDKGTLDIDGTWENLTAVNEGEFSIYLNAGESFQLDLFNPYQGQDAIFLKPDGSLVDLDSFVIQSDLGDTTILGELVNLTYLTNSDPASVCASVSTRSISKGLINISSSALNSSGFVRGFTGQDPFISECAYVLRLNNSVFLDPSKGGLFTVSIHDDQHGVVDPDNLAQFQNDLDVSRILIPSRVLIESEATVGKSLQRIQVRTPVRPPLSGLYDFVLFSEQAITK